MLSKQKAKRAKTDIFKTNVSKPIICKEINPNFGIRGKHIRNLSDFGYTFDNTLNNDCYIFEKALKNTPKLPEMQQYLRENARTYVEKHIKRGYTFEKILKSESKTTPNVAMPSRKR